MEQPIKLNSGSTRRVFSNEKANGLPYPARVASPLLFHLLDVVLRSVTHQCLIWLLVGPRVRGVEATLMEHLVAPQPGAKESFGFWR